MAKLKDICEIIMGQSPDSNSYNEKQDGLPFYQGNADFGEVTPNTRYWCNKPTKLATENDVLLSVRAPIGAVNIATERCCIGRGLASIREIKDTSFYKYLYYLVISKNKKLNSLGTGSTFKAINKSNLENIEVTLPSIPEQQRIAAELDAVCGVLAKQKKQYQLLNELVKSKFNEMFGAPEQNERGWAQKLFSAAYEIIDGDRGVNYPKQNEFSEIGHCLFLNAGNVTKVGFRFEQTQFITEAKDNALRKGKLKKYDLVLTTRGTVGNLAYYDDSVPYEHVRINSGMVILRKKTDILPQYFMVLFSHEAVYKKFISGTAQPQMPIGSMSKVLISIPPLTLQSKFADFVNQVEQSKAKLKSEITQTETLYKALMQKYFEDKGGQE